MGSQHLLVQQLLLCQNRNLLMRLTKRLPITFKGVVAWCFWGHPPNVGGAMMKSWLFTEAKISTSFGRKTSSRGAIKANSKSKGGTKVVTTSLSDSSSRSANKRRIQEDSTTSGMSLANETNKDEDKTRLSWRRRCTSFILSSRKRNCRSATTNRFVWLRTRLHPPLGDVIECWTGTSE